MALELLNVWEVVSSTIKLTCWRHNKLILTLNLVRHQDLVACLATLRKYHRLFQVCTLILGSFWADLNCYVSETRHPCLKASHFVLLH